MECGAYHREPVSLAKRTKRPSELGESAERSTMRRTLGKRSGCTLAAGNSASGEGSHVGGEQRRVHPRDQIEEATVRSSDCRSPIIGESIAI